MVAVLPTSSLEPSSEDDSEQGEKASGDPRQLRDADEALIKVIGERKRIMAERGIKLTVVLLTEREMLGEARELQTAGTPLLNVQS